MNESTSDIKILTTEATPAEKPYTFRPLGATDMMPMFRIIGKIGIDEFSKCFNSDAVQSILKNKEKETSKITDMVGLKIFLDAANVIISHIPDCEEEIFQMLASVSGLSVEAVKAFDFVTFTRMIIDFVKKEEFKDFIGVVSELFK
jgi:ABC-type Fe3+-hydroxamate transport system substrate-binding protein